MNAIDVRNIVKQFGQFTAVKGISFTVEDGEIFGLLGPNGAGKSTLIRMLVTLLPPTSGTAIVNGFDVVKQSDGVRRSIGVIPQAMTSDLELSVEENLLFYAKLYSVPREKRIRAFSRTRITVPFVSRSRAWACADVLRTSPTTNGRPGATCVHASEPSLRSTVPWLSTNVATGSPRRLQLAARQTTPARRKPRAGNERFIASPAGPR